MRETDGIKEKFITFVEGQYGIPREMTRELSYDEINEMIREKEQDKGKKK